MKFIKKSWYFYSQNENDRKQLMIKFFLDYLLWKYNMQIVLISTRLKIT